MERRTSRSGSPPARIARVLLGLLATGFLAGCAAPRSLPQTTPEPPAQDRTVRVTEIAREVAVRPPVIEPVAEAEVPPTAAPAVAPSEPPPSEPPVEPAYDLAIEINGRVRHWIDRYSGVHKLSFEAGMRRSGRYLEMFREIFAEEGVPRDLVYMAHVESGFKTRAYSRAHAKGIFQFISGTARRYDLRVDYWVDERSDPEKSARAAARYMKRLYDEFGDWYLALAAYNAGEGTVRRAISRTRSRDFWVLSRSSHLRRETKNHVPAVLAATLMYRDPAKYGLDVEVEPALHYDTIVVQGAADLGVLARCAATDLETLRGLNPALRRNQTPPDGRTDLRVPLGAGASTLAALQAVPAGERVLYTRYRIRRGDTLSGIARRHGVAVSAIQQTNGMGRRTTIHESRILLIPTSAANRTIPTVVGEPASHRVRRGETLSAIARRYDTTARSIAEGNGIPLHGVLGVGHVLTVVPGGRSASGLQHTIRRGDTLWGIAHLYQTSIHALCAMNGISQSTVLHPGVKLNIGIR